MNSIGENGRIRVGLAQLNSTDHKPRNLQAAEKAVRRLAGNGAELIVLPEHFDFIGADSLKAAEAEPLDSSSCLISLANLAEELGCYIHCGSFLEKDGDRIFNTGAVFDPSGRRIARYRKIHLFDVEIPGGKIYRESAVISPGGETASFSIGPFSFGMATCYDLRFPELFRRLVLGGANVILLPAAFTLQTGRDHWQVLLRARAIENLCWVVAVGQWGAAPPNHLCYGRSMVVNPWGLVVAQAADGVTSLVAEIDIDAVTRTRTEFPALDHVRDDLFDF
jgi:predicted amidohydrolase